MTENIPVAGIILTPDIVDFIKDIQQNGDNEAIEGSLEEVMDFLFERCDQTQDREEVYKCNALISYIRNLKKKLVGFYVPEGGDQ